MSNMIYIAFVMSLDVLVLLLLIIDYDIVMMMMMMMMMRMMGMMMTMMMTCLSWPVMSGARILQSPISLKF